MTTRDVLMTLSGCYVSAAAVSLALGWYGWFVVYVALAFVVHKVAVRRFQR